MKNLFLIIFSLIILTSFTDHTVVASYYGIEHHGKKMDNGKPFNMYALTTAHKTLKFGTKLKVTNIKNDKSVNVMVTDRGPYIKGRELDLSQAAFSKIASISSGHIKVKYEILE